MAENPIRHTEIIEIDKTIAGINRIIKQLKKLQATMKQTAKEVISFQQKQDPSTKAGKEGTKKATEETNRLIRQNEKLARSTKELTKEQIRLKKVRKDNLTEVRRQVQIMDTAKGSLDRNRVALQKLTERYGKAAPEAARRMENRVTSLTNKIKKQEQAIGRHQRNVGNYKSSFGSALKAAKSFGAGMLGVTAVISGFSRIMRAAKESSEEFESTFVTVLTLLDKAQISKFGGFLERGSEELIKKYGLSVTDANRALFDAISAGVEAGEAIEFMDAAARLAIGGNSDLTSVIKGVTKIMNAYNLEASDAIKITETLFAAQKVGQTTVGELATAIGTITAVAHQAGIGYDELLSVFAVLTKRLKSTDETATAIGATIDALIRPTDDAIKVFKEMGIETGITALRNNGLFETLVQITNATEENADALVEMIPQVRALRGIGSLTAEALLEYQSTLELVNNEQGAAVLLTDALNMQMDTHVKVLDVRKAKMKSFLRQESSGNFLLNIFTRRAAKKAIKLTENTELIEDQTEANEENLDIQRLLDEIEAKRQKRIAEAQAEKARERAAELGLTRAKQTLKMFAFETDLIEQELDRFLAAEEAKDDAHAERLEKQEEREKKSREFRSKLEEEFEKDAKARRKKAEEDEKRGKEAVLIGATDLLFALTDMRMSKLENEKRREIELAGDNKTKIAEIEKKFAQKQQGVAISQALINSALAITKVFGSIIPPFSFILAGLTAAATGIQIATIKAQTFALGGHGKLGGERHRSGGTYLPGIGIAEKDEYFGIVNRQMTRKYQNDLPAIFDSLNTGRFHDVWSNANIQLQSEIDPWTKKIYDTLQSQATVYTDSGGDTVKEYPNGKKVIIRGK